MARVSFLILSALIVADVSGKLPKTPKNKLGGRIVGGEATTIQEYPYQVSVGYVDSHYCGGSIINAYHVLTAAHCTNGVSAEDLFVRAGSTTANEGGQVRQVSQIFQHQNFDSETYDYDISILRLQEGLNFGSGVAAVTLPAQSDGNVDGDLLGTATGWGRLYENGPLPLELQKVELPTLEADICELVYGDSITVRMFCAGYVKGQKDTCQGDSGGPFVYNGVLLGITSWGDGCGAANSPGVYTKVSYFRNYIDGIASGTDGRFVQKADPRIVGGTAVTIQEYPYQVSVIYIDSHFCGGSLIHPQYVLTAAHCTAEMRPEYLLVRAGSTYVDQQGVVKQVTRINQHPYFDGDTLDNDLSILKVSGQFNLDSSIQVIPLPVQGDPVPANQLGVATGWGRLADGGAIPLELQKVDLPTLSQDVCRSFYRASVTDNMFCAGVLQGGKDTCQGDSGGPLVVNGVLAGITSWGGKCGEQNNPGVYTKVSTYSQYILSIICCS